MIVINGELRIGADDGATLVELLAPLVEKTRAEPGCERYAFSRDVEDEMLFRITEEWVDGDSLEAHMTSDHYRSFGKALRGLHVERMSILRYDVTNRTALV